MQPGEHLSIDGCPGLRIEATATRRAWTYRFRSPTDGRMRQTQIGLWPAMSFPSASAQWEILRNAREGGQDPALAKQQDRQARRDADKSATAMRQEQAYTVRRLCDDYLVHHVDRHRKEKAAAEVRRMFDTMLGAVAEVSVDKLTRFQAFDLLESHQGIPVQADLKLARSLSAFLHSMQGVPDRARGRVRDDLSRQVTRGIDIGGLR
ncbi:MAG TPA: integrase arm-type DNA-binding domain-containing protein [Caldimonas sp.]